VRGDPNKNTKLLWGGCLPFQQQIILTGRIGLGPLSQYASLLSTAPSGISHTFGCDLPPSPRAEHHLFIAIFFRLFRSTQPICQLLSLSFIHGHCSAIINPKITFESLSESYRLLVFRLKQKNIGQVEIYIFVGGHIQMASSIQLAYVAKKLNPCDTGSMALFHF